MVEMLKMHPNKKIYFNITLLNIGFRDTYFREKKSYFRDKFSYVRDKFFYVRCKTTIVSRLFGKKRGENYGIAGSLLFGKTKIQQISAESKSLNISQQC